jgi:hypothetical protein
MKANNVVMNEGMALANGKWKKYMSALTEGYKKTHGGKAPNSNLLATTAIMLENTQQAITRMDETTRVVNLGNFVDYGFGVITAIMPALVANEIVSIQPLKGRSGEVFFLDFKYGSNKGNITQGDSMISPFTGANPDTTYTGEKVPHEQLGTSAAGETALNGNLSFTPVVPGTVIIEAGTLSLRDDRAGNIVNQAGTVTGQVNYSSGRVELTGLGDPEASVSASYQFSYGNMDVGGNIPEMTVDLGSTTISSVTRSLRSRWLFDAAFELQQVHGINADEEIATAMAAEVRHEIDGEIMNDLWNQGNAGGGKIWAWSNTAPTGVAYIDYKDTFVDKLIEMSNAIFMDTKRAEGNYIVAGINVCSLIESMPGRFVPNGEALKAGPHITGTLDGRWKIIKNPFYSPNNFVVGYKGTSYLEGGYVYAPFLPLFTTPTVMLDDFVNRKGVRTIYGKKMLNDKFYAKGTITT